MQDVTYSPAFRQGLLKQQGLTAPLFALAGVVHALKLPTPPHGHVPWSDHNRNDALVLIVISFPRRDSWGILDSYTWVYLDYLPHFPIPTVPLVYAIVK
jgi:hypothetical protein